LNKQFSNDGSDVKEPQAPLPDESEVAEGDNDVEQEGRVQFAPLEPISRDASERILPKEELPSKI
jgi:hypothetical protein